jgi:TolA-binding protein
MNELDRLGQHVAEEQDAIRARSTDRALARERLMALDVPAKSRAPWRAGALALAAALVVAVGVTGYLRNARRNQALTATFGRNSEPAVVGTWLEAPEVDPLPLRFSEGTRIDIAPRSRARIVELGSAGAHLLLEGGGAEVSVTPRSQAKWLLSVGPFAVRVTGTRFDVRWDPDQDVFELDLHEGHVELSGCVFGAAYRLSAGEVARASCKRAFLQIADHKGAHADETPGAPLAKQLAPLPAQNAAPQPDEPAARREREPRVRAAAPEGTTSWRELANKEKYAEALAAANEAGFDAQCQRASASELALLGDTARFAGDHAKATRALTVLRRRFPGTAPAAQAAFLLGKLEFEGSGSFQKAADWFRTYFREQPNGPLAGEAHGRFMEALHRAGNDRAAREAAAQYLRDYPAGPFAALAKDIRGSTDP